MKPYQRSEVSTGYVEYEVQRGTQRHMSGATKASPALVAHNPHVTWAHVMLRVQLGCERRFTIEFYGADTHVCHSAYVTCSHVPVRLSHLCFRTHFVRRDDVT